MVLDGARWFSLVLDGLQVFKPLLLKIPLHHPGLGGSHDQVSHELQRAWSKLDYLLVGSANVC